ncbi:MAG: LPS export ABC transporter periplasmic protein LptC [Betaproteobacteria bacterium]|nr:LPS export ABC transporter periplasmic protein LptC [Betaproteobacteria bacterium]
MTDFPSRRALDRAVAWMPVLLLAGLAALTWWLDSQVQDAGPRRDGNARHDPDLFAEDVRGVELDEAGRAVQTLAAARARHYPDDGTVEFDDPRFVMTQPDRPKFTVRADRARVSGDRERAFFEGNVRAARAAEKVADGAGPVELATEYLEVIPKRDRAVTDRPVTITEPRGIIRATGLVLDNATKTATLRSEVRGTFSPPAR